MAKLDINIRQTNADFQAIKNKIIEKGVEVVNGTKTSDYASKIDEVYEKGKQAEYDRFWNDVLKGGERTNFNYAFHQWGSEYMRPPIKVVPTVAGSLNSTFNSANSLKKIEASYFDFSQVPRGERANQGYYHTFYNCTALEEIEDIGISPTFTHTYSFANDAKLRKIAKITVDADTKFSHAFDYCYELEDVTFEGIIGQNGLDLHWSTKLSKASITSIINALSTTTSGLTVTLSHTAAENAFLNIDVSEWEELIATKPNWTISLV